MSVNAGLLETLRRFAEGLQELEADTGLRLYSGDPIAVGGEAGESTATVEWCEDGVRVKTAVIRWTRCP